MKPKKFPSQKELKEVSEKLESALGSRMLSSDASAVDKIKFELCKGFIIYRKESGMSQKELAEKLSIDPALMSKILHYHIDEFTIDRLVRYLDTLKKEVRLHLA